MIQSWDARCKSGGGQERRTTTSYPFWLLLGIEVGGCNDEAKEREDEYRGDFETTEKGCTACSCMENEQALGKFYGVCQKTRIKRVITYRMKITYGFFSWSLLLVLVVPRKCCDDVPGSTYLETVSDEYGTIESSEKQAERACIAAA